jgi:hypothetical protein
MAFRWKSVAAGLAALALSATGAAAQVPGPRANELMLGLQEQQSGMGQDGFARAAGPLYGELAAGGNRPFPVMLRAGRQYSIAGVCDGRCTDLNLRVADQRGALVAADTAPDATPQMRVRPEMTGQHVIVVEMASCNAPSCWFAVNIYQR